MVNLPVPISPLELRGLRARDSADSAAGNRLRERPRLAIVNLRLDPKLAAKARKALGFDLPLTANRVQRDRGGRACYWLGPDEWLLVAEQDSAAELIAALSKALGKEHHALVDLSSNYDCLRLSGPDARAVLARAIPLDLSAARFAYGDCAQTQAARAQVLLTLVDDGANGPSFDLFCRRSFAQYLWTYLLDSGLRFGLTG